MTLKTAGLVFFFSRQADMNFEKERSKIRKNKNTDKGNNFVLMKMTPLKVQYDEQNLIFLFKILK